jgi:hypothetical protein
LAAGVGSFRAAAAAICRLGGLGGLHFLILRRAQAAGDEAAMQMAPQGRLLAMADQTHADLLVALQGSRAALHVTMARMLGRGRAARFSLPGQQLA